MCRIASAALGMEEGIEKRWRKCRKVPQLFTSYRLLHFALLLTRRQKLSTGEHIAVRAYGFLFSMRKLSAPFDVIPCDIWKYIIDEYLGYRSQLLLSCTCKDLNNVSSSITRGIAKDVTSYMMVEARNSSESKFRNKYEGFNERLCLR